jgi:ATP-dependent RNA helicase RhlE
MSFDSLGLTPELVRVVADEGYTEPTPVQREAIPLVLAGRDLLAGAQTGTGKTAAFVLPMLQRLHASGAEAPSGSPDGRRVQRPIRALVLTPTRELALQVEESVRTYGRRRPLPSVAIYGGVGFEPQVRALRRGPAIVVATPGRLLDHVGQRTIDLSQVEILVLDEADRMLDMGFIRDIRRVLGLLPPGRQNLLFSATFSDEIRSLAGGLLDRPATVDVAPRNTPAALVDHVVIPVDRHRKPELLAQLIRSGRVGQALVFTRTKHGANRLAEDLERRGIPAAAIHGNKSQGQRVRALGDFKNGRVGILVATDIAARGLDIDALPHVVNYELPMVASDYIHRIGRTGRAGTGGLAVSLVCVDESGLLREIEGLLRRSLPAEVVAGFEPDRSARPEPIRLRSGGAGRPAVARSRGGRPIPVAGRSMATPGRSIGMPGRSFETAGRRPDRGVEGPARHGGRSGVAGRPAHTVSGRGAQSASPPNHAHDGRRPSGRNPGPQRGTLASRMPVMLPGERLSRAMTTPTDDRPGTTRTGGNDR